MKHFLLGLTMATLVGSALATDVGVSVSIGQPGFYGRIVMGDISELVAHDPCYPLPPSC